MISLQITSLKIFMNQLLNSDIFDTFLLQEATIKTANTYTIDGRINVDFYPMAERTEELLPYEFMTWSNAKSLCYSLIKGKYTPISMKLILQLKPDLAQNLLTKEHSTADLSNVKALVLGIHYNGSGATLTTGTSYHSFMMDRTPDVIWDKALCKYLTGKGVPYDIE